MSSETQYSKLNRVEILGDVLIINIISDDIIDTKYIHLFPNSAFMIQKEITAYNLAPCDLKRCYELIHNHFISLAKSFKIYMEQI